MNSVFSIQMPLFFKFLVLFFKSVILKYVNFCNHCSMCYFMYILWEIAPFNNYSGRHPLNVSVLLRSKHHEYVNTSSDRGNEFCFISSNTQIQLYEMYSPVTWGFSFLFKEDIHQKSLYRQVRPQFKKKRKKRRNHIQADHPSPNRVSFIRSS